MMLKSQVFPGIPHGFSTREDPDFAAVLPSATVVLARQVHSSRVVKATGPWDGPPPEADALVTDRPGLLIGVVTADCAPVLFADREAGVIGAAHAGWRGAVDGVLAKTVEAMVALGARRDRIAAVIGPAIAQASYEVDAALRDRFEPAAQRFFAAGRPGHWQFDLPGFVSSQLREAGIANPADLAEDTYAQPGRFYSFRRATHRNEPTGGRQTSVIALSRKP